MPKPAGGTPTLPERFGGKGIRTPDFQLAKLALYQLSYAPDFRKSECRMSKFECNRKERARSRGPHGRGYSKLLLRLREIGAIQIELGLRDHFHVREIFLERLQKFRRFADDDQAHRTIEIFLGEGAYVFRGYGVDRRDESVQGIQREIVSYHRRNFPDETAVGFQISRVTTGQHRLARFQFVALHRFGVHPLQLGLHQARDLSRGLVLRLG